MVSCVCVCVIYLVFFLNNTSVSSRLCAFPFLFCVLLLVFSGLSVCSIHLLEPNCRTNVPVCFLEVSRYVFTTILIAGNDDEKSCWIISIYI